MARATASPLSSSGVSGRTTPLRVVVGSPAPYALTSRLDEEPSAKTSRTRRGGRRALPSAHAVHGLAGDDDGHSH